MKIFEFHNLNQALIDGNMITTLYEYTLNSTISFCFPLHSNHTAKHSHMRPTGILTFCETCISYYTLSKICPLSGISYIYTAHCTETKEKLRTLKFCTISQLQSKNTAACRELTLFSANSMRIRICTTKQLY